MTEIFIPKPDHMANLNDNPTQSEIKKDIEKVLEKDKANDSQLPEDINMSYMADPYKTSTVSRNKPMYSKKMTVTPDPEIPDKSRYNINMLYDEKVLQYGYRKSKYSGPQVDSFQLSGMKGSGKPKNVNYEGSLTENYNTANYKFRFGSQEQINKETADKLGINKYLIQGYNNQYKDIQNRGVFGRLGSQPYAGFQEWEKDNPMVKRNLAVNYTTIGSPALG